MRATAVLACCILLLLISSSESSSAYSHSVKFSDEMSLSWTMDTANGVLHGMLTVEQESCWAGIALNAKVAGMKGSSYIIGELKDGNYEVNDYVAGPRDGQPVAHSGAKLTTTESQDVQPGRSVYRFVRKLNAGADSALLSIKDSEPLQLAYAYCGKEGQAKKGPHNGNAGKYGAVDFFTGSSEKTNDKCGGWWVFPNWSVLIVAGVLGLSALACSLGCLCDARSTRHPCGFVTLIAFHVMLTASIAVSSVLWPFVQSRDPISFKWHGVDCDLALWYLMMTVLSGAVIVMPFQLVRVLRQPMLGRLWSSSFFPWLSYGECLGVSFYLIMNIWAVFTWVGAPHMEGLSWYVVLTRVVGHLTEMNLAMAILPVTRNSVWTVLTGVPFERAIRYHRWLGSVVFVLTTLHLLGWWVTWSVNVGFGAAMKCQFALQCDGGISIAETKTVLWGGLSYLFMLIVIVFAYETIRRKWFELFYYIHHLFIAIIVFASLHSATVNSGKNGRLLYYFAFTLSLYLCDKAARFYWSAVRTSRVQSLTVLPNGVTRVVLGKKMTYKAGQYCFVCIPSVSATQWHPVTISSAPNDDVVTFHIRDMGTGTWSARVRALARDVSIGKIENPLISLEGPYGHPGISVKSGHNRLILCAGGIGFTPVASILADALNQADEQVANGSKSASTPFVHVVWAVRSVECVAWFETLLERVESHTTSGVLVDIYITNNARPNSNYSSSQTMEDPLLCDQQRFEVMRISESKNVVYHEGRPNWEEVAQVTANDIRSAEPVHGKGPVGLFVCGVEAMVGDIVSACSRNLRSSEHDIHKETFCL